MRHTEPHDNGYNRVGFIFIHRQPIFTTYYVYNGHMTETKKEYSQAEIDRLVANELKSVEREYYDKWVARGNEIERLEKQLKKVSLRWSEMVREDHDKFLVIEELRKDVERAQWIIQINNEMFVRMQEKRLETQFE